MSLGLYNGTDNGVNNGLYNGTNLGVVNGLNNNYDYTTRIVTDSLRLYFDPTDARSNPGSGTTVYDLSGNGYNGTLNNGAFFSNFQDGCIVTDGINDSVTTAAASLGSATSNYSYGGWYRCTDFSNAKYILTRGRDNFGSGWSLFVYVGTDRIPAASFVYTLPSVVAAGCSGSIPIKLNTWFHIMGVWVNGSGISLYINGQFQNSLATTGTSLRSSTTGWCMGTVSNSGFSSGNSGIMYVYNRALTPAEIYQNFNAHRKKYGL